MTRESAAAAPHAPGGSSLDSWSRLPLESVLEQARDLVENPDFPTVRAWRASGGKVLGHFQVYFPEELAHAAGLLPIKISGAQVEGMEAESHFGSYLCSIVKTSLELALTRKIELDLFVTHPICDAARNLAAIWGRNFPYKCQILYLPQNPNSPAAATWLRHESARLRHGAHRIASPGDSGCALMRRRSCTDRSVSEWMAPFADSSTSRQRSTSKRRPSTCLARRLVGGHQRPNLARFAAVHLMAGRLADVMQALGEPAPGIERACARLYSIAGLTFKPECSFETVEERQASETEGERPPSRTGAACNSRRDGSFGLSTSIAPVSFREGPRLR